ncbi:terpenoid synthase [Stereum hirsutum FP-91666 SS1]|uniref:terpenoid synthase n=1 Tax=Stereum hirsutum (strain FP-91666) TaxID=721885 RepID=UPI000440AB66|nr:terpenoid synthase [Stereum hirsutum FP-91666 SS1]EIM92377.1 terpenoid synthase [Stereum hirsutum FP-91666 SS1]
MRRWSTAAASTTRLSRSSDLTSVTRRCIRQKYSVLAARPAPVAEQTTSIPPSDATSTVPPLRPDPYTLLTPQLNQLRDRLLNLLGSAHPTLTDIAKYYFLHPSKQLRPLLVLLFSHATNGLGRDWELKKWAAECEGARGRAEELDQPLSRPDVLNDWNPNMPDHTSSFDSVFSLIPPRPPLEPPVPPPHPSNIHSAPSLASPSFLLPTQLRLAQIVEMIHVASLLHDDVIDSSDLRRGVPSAPAAFGNKLTILGGDFLLGRASAALSRLGESEVTELIASVIANLVEGEILQLSKVGQVQSEKMVDARVGGGKESWNVYLRKTYLKTASLMAKGARASVVLGGSKEGEVWKEVAYAYGRNLGIAFQLVDDILDYEAGEATLGKPGGADLRLGLATGPALYAWEEHPEMGPLIMRKFEKDGDVELARDLVRRSSGVERTRDLARAHADKAKETIQLLPDSDAKIALEVLTERVVKRTW